jgi:hypothetical protein
MLPPNRGVSVIEQLSGQEHALNLGSCICTPELRPTLTNTRLPSPEKVGIAGMED